MHVDWWEFLQAPQIFCRLARRSIQSGKQSEKFENSRPFRRKERSVKKGGSLCQRVDSKGEREAMKGFHRGRRKVPFFTPMGAGGDDSTRRPETKKRPNDRAFLRAVRPFTEARSIGLKAPRRSRASRCFARTKRRGDARSSPSPGRVRTLRCSPSAPHSRAPSSDAASPRFSSRGDAHSRRRASPGRARLRVPSRLLGWGRSVVRGGRSPRHEALRRAGSPPRRHPRAGSRGVSRGGADAPPR